MTRRFSKVNIEISNICNLQCSFCPEVIRAKRTMDLELFERITAQVASLTDQVTYHLMGDPLVHKKLPQFLAISARHNTPVFLVTNGVLLDDSKIQDLLHPIIRQVNFSIHSFHDNFPDRDPGEYLEKIFKFVDLAFTHRPDLYINFRLWNLKAQGARPESNRQILGEIHRRFGVTPPESPDVRITKSFKIKNRLYLHYDTEFVWPNPSLPMIGEKGTCLGLRNHFGILVDGTVVPCCLDSEGRIPLGNIQDTPVTEILAGEKAQKILKGFLERRLIDPLCQRCNYVTRF